MEKEINIQWSSSSLANTKEGLFTAAETTINSLISKEFYTNTVFDNAEKFALETREVLPDSTFGVSILPTMMSKRNLGEFVEYIENGSIDIPYIINWLKLPKEKAQELISQNGIGLDTALTYGLETAYAMMQASSKKELERKVNESLALFPEDSPVTMRTCIENFSNEKVIDVVNELSSRNRNVKYALEPNVKLVNTLSEYIAYIDQLRKDNPELDIGLDLDLIHLNEERNLLEILDRLEGSKHFPLMISLGGAVLSEENVRLNTHLPLNLQDDTTVRKLGEFYSKLRFRNEKLPSLVFETSPAEKTLFESYQDFLKSFSEGLN